MTANQFRLFTAAMAVVVLAAMAIVASIGNSTPVRAAPAAIEGNAATERLRFYGTGTARVAPDTAEFDATVEATGRSRSRAEDAASRKMRDLASALREAGIEQRNLETTDVSAYPATGTRWRASSSIEVTVRDTLLVGKLLRLSTKHDARTSSPEFSLRNRQDGYRLAVERAVDDARAKALAVAEPGGLSVGLPVKVDEQVEPRYEIYGKSLAMPAAAMAERSIDVPVQRGTEEVTVTVRADFGYEDD